MSPAPLTHAVGNSTAADCATGGDSLPAAALPAGLSDPTSAEVDVEFAFDDEPPQADAPAGNIKTIARTYVFIRSGRVIGADTYENTGREGNRCGE